MLVKEFWPLKGASYGGCPRFLQPQTWASVRQGPLGWWQPGDWEGLCPLQAGGLGPGWLARRHS